MSPQKRGELFLRIQIEFYDVISMHVLMQRGHKHATQHSDTIWPSADHHL